MHHTFDIWIQNGSSFNLTLDVQTTSGTPLNLSGYGFYGGIKYSYGDSGYLLDLAPYADSVIMGQIDISVPGSQISGLPITKGIWSVEAYQSGTNYNFQVVRGYANIAPLISDY